MSSMVKIQNGGYDDIVVAIHPGIPENDRIIEKIQNMVTEASDYLFHATKRRLSISHVNILIPKTWTTQSKYMKRKRESYNKADVIIAETLWNYGDDPYTLQYRGCGEKGKYIHLTPTFLLDGNLTSVYGTPGRVFVHEWAHLRWGVFDEYNVDIPYYISRDLKVEATRCSLAINGTNRVKQCERDSCTTRNCNIDPQTGLYEDKCLFLPLKEQSAQESIMYLQALSSVSEFCNETTHNIEAPTPQNRMCNSHSTWDVIMRSPDLISSPPKENMNIPIPSFSLLQYRDRVVTLLLDVSGSMKDVSLNLIYQAADVFIMQIIETGSYVGIVEHHGYSSVITKPVRLTNDTVRENLKSLLPLTATHTSTSLCPGILLAIEVNKYVHSSPEGTEIILVLDGEDPFLTDCFSEVNSSGVIIHVIALGPAAEKKLEQLADMTGGLKYFATEKPDANDLIEAFSSLAAGNGDGYQQVVQVESAASSLEPSECLNGTVSIDSTIGRATFFLITWELAVPAANLQDPNKTLYTQGQFTNNTASKSSRLQIPGTARKGEWSYSLCNNQNSSQVIGLTVTSKAADASMPPVMVTIHMNKDTYTYPELMIAYASVNIGTLPTVGWKVTAIIEPENGNQEILELLDNGAGADMAKGDGVYSKYFTAVKHNGRHSLRVFVENKENHSRLARSKMPALYIPGYGQNGEFYLNPSHTPVNDDHLPYIMGSIKRVASGGSFVITGVPTVSQAVYKPSKIHDLAAATEEHRVVLSWTATGDDLDQGSASSYDLRMSIDPKKLRDDFNSTLPIDLSTVLPQKAGSVERFIFVPDAALIGKATVLYFAVIAIDKDNLRSDLSNIAQAAILSLTTEPTSLLTSTSPGSTFPVTSFTTPSTYPRNDDTNSTTNPTPTNNNNSATPGVTPPLNSTQLPDTVTPMFTSSILTDNSTLPTATLVSDSTSMPMSNSTSTANSLTPLPTIYTPTVSNTTPHTDDVPNRTLTTKTFTSLPTTHSPTASNTTPHTDDVPNRTLTTKTFTSLPTTHSPTASNTTPHTDDVGNRTLTTKTFTSLPTTHSPTASNTTPHTDDVGNRTLTTKTFTTLPTTHSPTASNTTPHTDDVGNRTLTTKTFTSLPTTHSPTASNTTPHTDDVGNRTFTTKTFTSLPTTHSPTASNTTPHTDDVGNRTLTTKTFTSLPTTHSPTASNTTPHTDDVGNRTLTTKTFTSLPTTHSPTASNTTPHTNDVGNSTSTTKTFTLSAKTDPSQTNNITSFTNDVEKTTVIFNSLTSHGTFILKKLATKPEFLCS
ncbi:calcium-activated chloride channel regulator 1-like [Pelodytes ibericus]